MTEIAPPGDECCCCCKSWTREKQWVEVEQLNLEWKWKKSWFILPTWGHWCQKRLHDVDCVEVFGCLKNNEDQIKPVCKICQRLVPSRTGSTTNLFHRLKRYHPCIHTESLKMWAYVCPPPHTWPAGRRPSSSAVSCASVSGAVALPKQQSVVVNSRRSENITAVSCKANYCCLISYRRM